MTEKVQNISQESEEAGRALAEGIRATSSVIRSSGVSRESIDSVNGATIGLEHEDVNLRATPGVADGEYGYTHTVEQIHISPHEEVGEHTYVKDSNKPYDDNHQLSQTAVVTHKKTGSDEKNPKVTYSYTSGFYDGKYDAVPSDSATQPRARVERGEAGYDNRNKSYTRSGVRVDRVGAKGEKVTAFLTGERAEKARNILQRRAAKKLGNVSVAVEKSKKDAA